jgi:purine nucleoside phosphorylase
VFVCDRVKFEQVEETAKYILSKTKYRPEIAIVCGTGLGGIGELIKEGFSIPYETIPNFVSPRGKHYTLEHVSSMCSVYSYLVVVYQFSLI